MTNHWVDLKNSDLVIVMGGNAAEAHPCGFKWVIEAKKDRKAKLIVVDPRFTRSAAVSDFYAPIRAGSDIAFLGGVINYLLSNNKIHLDYVKNYTNAAFLIDEGFKFEDGLFSGYNAEKRSYGKDTWKYQIGKDGFAMVDPTLESPNCVFQLMKKHYSRYTPDLVSKTTGTPKDAFLKICEMMAETAAPDKTMTICYALGWTEHSVGSQNIRTMAMIQLLLGNMGMAGGGINALRGHANVQGITDMCLYSARCAGLPGRRRPMQGPDSQDLSWRSARPSIAAEPDELLAELSRSGSSACMKAWYGNAATDKNDYGYDWLPKIDGAYDTLAHLRAHAPGQDERLLLPGLQPAGIGGEQEEGRRRAGEA
jgi:anaerobic selenocysteine-containing dehydrogenase